MKKVLILFAMMFMFIGNAEAGRNGVQFGSSGTVNFIHYGDDYEWAAGVGLGYEEDHELFGLTESDIFKVGIFARKNFKIHEKTYAGLGVWAQWGMGETEIEVIQGIMDVDVDVFSISPYLLIEHHLTEHLFLSAGAEIVRFQNTEYEVEPIESDEDDIAVFQPFISLAYVF